MLTRHNAVGADEYEKVSGGMDPAADYDELMALLGESPKGPEPDLSKSNSRVTEMDQMSKALPSPGPEPGPFTPKAEKSSEAEESGQVERPEGDPYEYRKDGDKLYTRKRGSGKWITLQGSMARAVDREVFGGRPAPDVRDRDTSWIDGEPSGGPDREKVEASIERLGGAFGSDGRKNADLREAYAERAFKKTLEDIPRQ